MLKYCITLFSCALWLYNTNVMQATELQPKPKFTYTSSQSFDHPFFSKKTVCKHDNQEVGHIYYNCDLTTKQASIDDFWVVKEYRKQKIGSCLLRNAIQFLLDHNFTDIRLTAIPMDNDVSHSDLTQIYQHCGFEIIGKNDYDYSIMRYKYRKSESKKTEPKKEAV